jgi:hypothetical protein
MTGACVSAPGEDLTFSRTSINCPLQARHYLRLITRLITTVGGTKTNILLNYMKHDGSVRGRYFGRPKNNT